MIISRASEFLSLRVHLSACCGEVGVLSSATAHNLRLLFPHLVLENRLLGGDITVPSLFGDLNPTSFGLVSLHGAHPIIADWFVVFGAVTLRPDKV